MVDLSSNNIETIIDSMIPNEDLLLLDVGDDLWYDPIEYELWLDDDLEEEDSGGMPIPALRTYDWMDADEVIQ